MNVTIELSDEQAAALKVQALAQGLTVEHWLERLASQFAPSASIAHLQKTEPRRVGAPVSRVGRESRPHDTAFE